MTILVKQGGAWVDSKPHVRDGGVWKPVIEGYVREGGTWKEFHGTPITWECTSGEWSMYGENWGVSYWDGGSATPPLADPFPPTGIDLNSAYCYYHSPGPEGDQAGSYITFATSLDLTGRIIEIVSPEYGTQQVTCNEFSGYSGNNIYVGGVPSNSLPYFPALPRGGGNFTLTIY